MNDLQKMITKFNLEMSGDTKKYMACGDPWNGSP